MDQNSTQIAILGASHMKRKFDGIIAATFLTTMFYSSTYPYIHKFIISIIPDSFIAGQQIVNCISIILFGWIWNKLPDKLFRWFPLFCILEFVTTISATSFIIVTGNVAAYYILDTVFFAIVTRNIVCGIFKLRARRYRTEQQRTEFDNLDNSAAALATIIGSVISMIMSFDFHTMLIIASFGNLIDNVLYIIIYYKTIQKAGEPNE